MEFEDKEQFVGFLLGALVDQMGGVVEIDKAALQKFIENDYYAVKLDFTDDKVILEVVDEDPAKG